MTKRLLGMLMVVCALSLAPGCGGDDAPTSSDQPTGSHRSQDTGNSDAPSEATLQCGNQICDAATEYCFQEVTGASVMTFSNCIPGQECTISQQGSGGTVTYAACVKLPSGCSNCDCAEADVQKDHAQSCHAIGCESDRQIANGQSSSLVDVTCYPDNGGF
jgi:hypothetical protein